MSHPLFLSASLARAGASGALTAAILLGAAASAKDVMPHHAQHVMHHQIEKLEAQWKKAMLSNNIADMDYLLAPEYIAITPSGTIETKDQVLAARKSSAIHIEQIELKDTKIRFFGGTAVVTSRATLTGTSSGRDISGRYSYTRVYNYRGNQWKIVSFEASRVRDPDDRAEKH